MSGAGQALQSAAIQAVRNVDGLTGVYPGPPLQAAFPHAIVEAGFEADWSHKSGKGREVRLAVQVRSEGERPDRLQALLPEVEAAVDGLPSALPGWRIVSLQFQRARTVRETKGPWTALLEYRARLLAEPA